MSYDHIRKVDRLSAIASSCQYWHSQKFDRHRLLLSALHIRQAADETDVDLTSSKLVEGNISVKFSRKTQLCTDGCGDELVDRAHAWRREGCEAEQRWHQVVLLRSLLAARDADSSLYLVSSSYAEAQSAGVLERRDRPLPVRCSLSRLYASVRSSRVAGGFIIGSGGWGSYSMSNCAARMVGSSARSRTSQSAMSMPADTPAAVMILPCWTKRSRTKVEPSGSSAAH